MHVVPRYPTTEDRRERFATNVRQLLRVLQVRSKDAARQIGVPDDWLLQIAQAGISRISDRQSANLQRFAASSTCRTSMTFGGRAFSAG